MIAEEVVATLRLLGTGARVRWHIRPDDGVYLDREKMVGKARSFYSTHMMVVGYDPNKPGRGSSSSYAVHYDNETLELVGDVP